MELTSCVEKPASCHHTACCIASGNACMHFSGVIFGWMLLVGCVIVPARVLVPLLLVSLCDDQACLHAGQVVVLVVALILEDSGCGCRLHVCGPGDPREQHRRCRVHVVVHQHLVGEDRRVLQEKKGDASALLLSMHFHRPCGRNDCSRIQTCRCVRDAMGEQRGSHHVVLCAHR